MMARTSFSAKNDDGIHIRRARRESPRVRRRASWPAFPLQCANGIVAIHRDDEFAAEFARRVQIANVADMQQIEAAIGQSDAITGVPPVRHALLKFLARNDLLDGEMYSMFVDH